MPASQATANCSFSASLNIARRLSNLQRLLISLDTNKSKDSDLYADNQGVIEAIIAFRPLEYLCLRGVRNVATIHTILSRHGPTLRGLSIEPTKAGRAIRPFSDHHSKSPNLTPRSPAQTHKGNRDEYAKCKAIGSFTNLRSLLLDLHYDSRTAPIDRHWRPSASELKDILINAATDKHLAHSIWTIVSTSQPSRCLRNLSCHPYGSEIFKIPEAYLVMTIAQTYLVNWPVFDAFEPLEVKRVDEGGYELELCFAGG
ncbi:hypothetical protein BDV12DRAFT_195165 [Aspergillus spectabilis]